MSKKILSLILSGIFILGFTACDDEDEEESNLVEMIVETESLSYLQTIIEYVDANSSLQDEARLSAILEIEMAEYTVFAPNNDAIIEVLDVNDDSVFDELDINALETGVGGAQNLADALYLAVANHILTVSERTSELEDAEELVTLANPQGDNSNFGLVVSADSEISIIPSYAPSAGAIVQANIEVSNGVVHIIDSLLLDTQTANLLLP